MYISDCCDALPENETYQSSYGLTGMCSKCKENTVFHEDEQITSAYAQEARLTELARQNEPEYVNKEELLDMLDDKEGYLAEKKRLTVLLDEVDEVLYGVDGSPIEKPDLALLRDILFSYSNKDWTKRGDEGGNNND